MTPPSMKVVELNKLGIFAGTLTFSKDEKPSLLSMELGHRATACGGLGPGP